MSLSKEEKRGIQILFEEIKKLNRYSQCWEWIQQSDSGQYLERKDVFDKIIELLND